MAKYSEKLANKLAKLTEEGYTVGQICNMSGISRKTFYEWKKTNVDFAHLIEEAEEMCNQNLVAEARKSLQKKLAGYSLTESKATYVPDENDPTQLRLKTYVVTTKEHVADAATIKLALSRGDTAKQNDADSNVNKNSDSKSNRPILNITVKTPEAAETLAQLQRKLTSE